MENTRVSLLQRVADPTDHASWAELVALYEPLLLGYLEHRRGVPASDARDVVQEVFLKLLDKLRHFQYDPAKGKFRSWLFTLASRVLADFYRTERRFKRVEAARRVGWKEESDSEEEEWAAMHDRRVVRFAVERVRADTAEKTWQCFEEHVLHGRKGEEVGAALGLPANTVYVHARRVLDRIRQRLAAYREDLGHD
jgi:RNA polymerase sigma-70 factor (ECF subfamily)